MAEESLSNVTEDEPKKPEPQSSEDKEDEESDQRKERDSILNDPAATHEDILRRYQTVKRKNDERIQNLLNMQNRMTAANLRKGKTNWPGRRKSVEESALEEEWKIIPSSLILHPPYLLMDTVDLEASFPEEKSFRTSVSLNPEDWTISVLPENGTLSSEKNVGLLIKCETKNSEFPKNKSQQKGIIEVCLDDKVKELVILIKYIPISFGTWIVCKDHPGRRPSPTQINQQQQQQEQQQQQQQQQQQKQPQKQTIFHEKNQYKSKMYDGLSNNETLLLLEELQVSSENDLWKQLKGIALTNRKAMENLSIKQTRKNVFHNKRKESTQTSVAKQLNKSETAIQNDYPSSV